MTVVHVPRPDVVEPLDPASPQGIAAARALTELLADVDERLARESGLTATAQPA